MLNSIFSLDILPIYNHKWSSAEKYRAILRCSNQSLYSPSNIVDRQLFLWFSFNLLSNPIAFFMIIDMHIFNSNCRTVSTLENFERIFVPFYWNLTCKRSMISPRVIFSLQSPMNVWEGRENSRSRSASPARKSDRAFVIKDSYVCLILLKLQGSRADWWSLEEIPRGSTWADWWPWI